MVKFKRVLLKLSGEALAKDNGSGFSEEAVLTVAEQVKRLLSNGTQVAIVIGGGNFWRGRSNPKMDRTKADQIGMTATIMNCLYTSEMFRTEGIKAVVQTPFKFSSFTEEFSKEAANMHLNSGTVVFFAGGTGHPFFSTDTAIALRAAEMEADIILLAKNIDGVYNKDPKKHEDAYRYDRISLREVIEKKLQVMDLTASVMCYEQHIPMRVFYLNSKDSILNAISDDFNGTDVYVENGGL